MRIIPIKTDYAFKELMSHEAIRKQFISDVLQIPLEKIRSVQLSTPFLRRGYRRQKQGILDVAVVMNDDTKMDIEMQLRPQKFWRKRGLYYLAKMYTDEFWVGENYEKLHRCVAIQLLDFNLSERREYHSVYTLKDQYGEDYGNLFEIHTIEMKKHIPEGDLLGDWIRLLNAESTEDLDKIAVHNEGMKEAKEVVKAMSLGRGLKWMYDQHQKALRDRWAEDEYVRDEGRAEGRAANLIDNVEELCRNMDVEPKTACKMIGVTYEQYASALSIMKEARNGQKK